MKKRGFTLIELLVVIAIIGILAAIVLVSLTGARKKAKDAAIQTDMAQVRTLAEEVYLDNNSKYDDLCKSATSFDDESTNASGYGAQLEALQTDAITTQGGTDLGCQASGEKYCFYITMNAAGKYYCVDSSGKAGMTTTDPSNTCDGTTYVCP